MTILPTIRQLQYLIALDEHKSFSKAANHMHVTQPTLSAGVRELETLLDAQLIERRKRGLQLTPAGKQALEYATQILHQAEGLVGAVNKATTPLTGRFHLGIIPTIAPFYLAHVMETVRQIAPELTLVVREDYSHNITAALQRGTLDGAVLALPYPTHGIDHHIITDDAFWLLTPETHTLAKQPKISAKNLENTDILLLEDGHCLRDHVLAACPTNISQNGDTPTAASLYTLVHLVAANLGVTLVPKMALDAGLIRGLPVVARPFKDPQPTRDIALIWRQGSARSEDAKLIAQAL